MNLTSLQNAHQAIINDELKDWGLQPLETADLQTNHQDFNDPESAWKAIAEKAPRNGWVLWQSHQTHFENGLPNPKPEWGVLLAAEAVLSDTESLRLDYIDDHWRLTTHCHQPDGAQYLCDRTHQLLHRENDKHLCYRRYWHIDPIQGAVQLHAVFAGIEEKGGCDHA